MRYTTKTEYGLMCLVYMARHQEVGARITIKELTNEERYPVAYIEKILRALRVADIVISYQGSQGGYALARPASEITLRRIVEALEGQTFDLFCDHTEEDEIVCNHHVMCSVMPIWQKTKELLDNFYDSITLEIIAFGDYPIKKPVIRNNPRVVALPAAKQKNAGQSI